MLLPLRGKTTPLKPSWLRDESQPTFKPRSHPHLRCLVTGSDLRLEAQQVMHGCQA